MAEKKDDDQPQVTNSVVTVSEARIRQIVREEIAEHDKRQLALLRSQVGPMKYEVK